MQSGLYYIVSTHLQIWSQKFSKQNPPSSPSFPPWMSPHHGWNRSWPTTGLLSVFVGAISKISKSTNKLVIKGLVVAMCHHWPLSCSIGDNASFNSPTCRKKQHLWACQSQGTCRIVYKPAIWVWEWDLPDDKLINHGILAMIILRLCRTSF